MVAIQLPKKILFPITITSQLRKFCEMSKFLNVSTFIVFSDIDTIEIRTDEESENTSTMARRNYNYKARIQLPYEHFTFHFTFEVDFSHVKCSNSTPKISCEKRCVKI